MRMCVFMCVLDCPQCLNPTWVDLPVQLWNLSPTLALGHLDN